MAILYIFKKPPQLALHVLERKKERKRTRKKERKKERRKERKKQQERKKKKGRKEESKEMTGDGKKGQSCMCCTPKYNAPNLNNHRASGGNEVSPSLPTEQKMLSNFSENLRT